MFFKNINYENSYLKFNVLRPKIQACFSNKMNVFVIIHKLIFL